MTHAEDRADSDLHLKVLSLLAWAESISCDIARVATSVEHKRETAERDHRERGVPSVEGEVAFARSWQSNVKIRALMFELRRARELNRDVALQIASAKRHLSRLRRPFNLGAKAARQDVDRALTALSRDGDASHRRGQLLSDECLIVCSGLFDQEMYLANNSDVAAAGVDPAKHFIRHGGKEGRAAGPLFSSQSYLDANRDVREAGLNPLVHFILFGIVERRPGGVALHLLPFAPDQLL